MFKKYVQRRLEKYVKKYFKSYHPKLIVVAGSVGKTTTKNAIAALLSNRYRIQMDPTNHNSEISVPLAIMGIKFPPPELLKSPKTWFKVFRAMRQVIKSGQGVDVIIQELATDKPGDIDAFGRYLKPDIAIITAVSPEHMENFPEGLAQVAAEELSIAKYAKLTMVGSDDVDDKFSNLAETNQITSYGLDSGEYRLDIQSGTPLEGYDAKFFAPEFGGATAENPDTSDQSVGIPVRINLVGEHSLKAACAAGAVAAKMGLTINEISDSISKLKPIKGRMNPLKGVRNSTLIDDTYNSSPSAAIAALKTIYDIDAPQRIAILGSMNELGKYSKQAHEEVGAYCSLSKLDYVITIGEDAARYLAPAARANSCSVASFPGPVMAAAFVNKIIKPGAVILIKGSQNGVFAEEATKALLASNNDVDQLVRQSEDWMDKKTAWMEEIRRMHTQNFDNE